MSLSATGRLLRRMGLFPQRPPWRAYQADPDAVEAWKREKFPAIRAEAARAGGVIFFQDEASVRSDFPWGHNVGGDWLYSCGQNHRGPLQREHDVCGVASGAIAFHVG